VTRHAASTSRHRSGLSVGRGPRRSPTRRRSTRGDVPSTMPEPHRVPHRSLMAFVVDRRRRLDSGQRGRDDAAGGLKWFADLDANLDGDLDIGEAAPVNMTLRPSARRPALEPRNAYTSSSSLRQSVGDSRHVVLALTTAVGHSAVRSTVTSYAATVPLRRHGPAVSSTGLALAPSAVAYAAWGDVVLRVGLGKPCWH